METNSSRISGLKNLLYWKAGQQKLRTTGFHFQEIKKVQSLNLTPFPYFLIPILQHPTTNRKCLSGYVSAHI